MYYQTGERPSVLPHDPFKAIVSPRPIGWISTLSAAGIANLAPYSFFNGISNDPPMVMFSSQGLKDTIKNIMETGEFTCNFAGYSQRLEMNKSSAPAPQDVSEFEFANVEAASGTRVACPRVAKAAAALECKLLQIVNPGDLDGNPTGSHMIIGQVVGTYIDDAMISDGRFDVMKAQPASRLGYFDFSHVDAVFEIPRPDYP